MIRIIINYYKISKIECTLWLVKNLWFIVPVNSYKTWSYFIKAKDHTFYGFTHVITHLGCWENAWKACKSLAFSSWFSSSSHVLPTSRMGYHTGKPIESVVYCLNKLPESNGVASLLWGFRFTDHASLFVWASSVLVFFYCAFHKHANS